MQLSGDISRFPVDVPQRCDEHDSVRCRIPGQVAPQARARDPLTCVSPAARSRFVCRDLGLCHTSSWAGTAAGNTCGAAEFGRKGCCACAGWSGARPGACPVVASSLERKEVGQIESNRWSVSGIDGGVDSIRRKHGPRRLTTRTERPAAEGFREVQTLS